MPSYHTYYPSKVVLNDGKEVPLGFNDNQSRMLVTEASAPLETLQDLFKREGFTETDLEETKPYQISKGVFKRLTQDWDMHVRFLQFHQGFIAIDAEVETSREYLQHIGGKWISVVYEVMAILQKSGIAFVIWHKNSGNYVKTILENVSLVLKEIANKVEWKPLVIGSVVGISIGMILDDEKIIRGVVKATTKALLNKNKPQKLTKKRSKSKYRQPRKNKKRIISYLKRKVFGI